MSSPDATPPLTAPAALETPTRLERLLRLIGYLSNPNGASVLALTSPADRLSAIAVAVPSIASTLTPGDVALAVSICAKLRGLCQPRLAPFWTWLADATATRNKWQPKAIKYTAIAIPLLAAAVIAPSLFRGRGFADWSKATAPDGAAASSLQSTIVLLGQGAGSVSAFPAGAYVHAQAALSDLDAANRTLAQIWVIGNDPSTLHAAFADHPDANAVKTHDAPLRDAAALKVKTARSELDVAHRVLSYAQQWANLGLPSSLPSSLAGAWSTAATDMENGLRSGDATILQRADDRLSYLQTAGQQLSAVQAWSQDFDADDLHMVQPITDALVSAIIADDREAVIDEVNRWQALKEARQLSYFLLVSSSPADPHGVQRKLAGVAGTPTDYLIVNAMTSSGQPMTLPVYDTEARRLAHVPTFGIQVTPEIYEAAKSQIDSTHSALLVAQKGAGQAAPVFTIPVLSGRITHW